MSFGAALPPPGSCPVSELGVSWPPLNLPFHPAFYSPSPSCHWVTVWGDWSFSLQLSIPDPPLALGLWERALPLALPGTHSCLCGSSGAGKGGGQPLLRSYCCLCPGMLSCQRKGEENVRTGGLDSLPPLLCPAPPRPPQPTWSPFGVSRGEAPRCRTGQTGPC